MPRSGTISTRSLILQSSEESSKRSARPSLLTPAQQAEADRNRILTKLEHGKAQPPAAAAKPRRPLAWGAAGLLALAAIGGGVFWTVGDQPEAAAPTVLAAAPVAPVRAVEPEPVPAAAIHDEPAAAKPTHDDLRNALEEGAVAAKKPEPKLAKAMPDDLRSALEEGTAIKKTPAPRPAAAATKVAVKPAPKPAAKPAPKAPVRKTPAHAAPDSDVALLAALVAHTQASRGNTEGSRTLRNELKACRRLSGAKARDCREEACLGKDRSVAACR
jgi:hypothetical protein